MLKPSYSTIFLLERIFIKYDFAPELKNNTELKRKILDFGKVAT